MTIKAICLMHIISLIQRFFLTTPHLYDKEDQDLSNPKKNQKAAPKSCVSKLNEAPLNRAGGQQYMAPLL